MDNISLSKEDEIIASFHLKGLYIKKRKNGTICARSDNLFLRTKIHCL